MFEGERGRQGDHGQKGDAGPTGERGRTGRVSRLSLIGYLILMVGVAAAIGISQHHYNQTFDAIEDARMERVDTLNRINEQQCKEIESLKRQFREDAIASYERADETLRLLNLEATPERLARFRADRDDTLRRFNPGTCPRERLE
jgi:hypothetical protein